MASPDLGPIIQSGYLPCSGLKVSTQYTHCWTSGTYPICYWFRIFPKSNSASNDLTYRRISPHERLHTTIIYLIKLRVCNQFLSCCFLVKYSDLKCWFCFCLSFWLILLLVIIESYSKITNDFKSKRKFTWTQMRCYFRHTAWF